MDGWCRIFFNADYLARYLVPSDHFTCDGIEITQERWLENGRVNKRIRLRHKETETVFCESVRLLRLEDFQRLYVQAGLEIQNILGDYEGRPFTPESPRLILYARKPA